MKRTALKFSLALLLLVECGWLAEAQEDPENKPAPSVAAPKAPEVTIEAPVGWEAPRRMHRREIVSFGQDVTLNKGEVCREMVVIGGNAKIHGTVEGDLVVVLGTAEITGTVRHGLVVVMGSANMKETAKVGRDAVVVGGTLDLRPGAAINGTRREVVLDGVLPDFHWVADWLRSGVLLARPLPPRIHWVWMVAGLLLVFYLLLAVLFSRPLQACVTAIETRPAGSFFTGVLALVLLGPLLFLLVISVAGILVIPVVLFAFLAILFFGKVAIYRTTGEQLGRTLKLPGLQHPAVALLIGISIFYLLYTVPLLGFVVWGVATVWGIGAVLVAIFANFRREQEPPVVTTTSAALTGITPSLAEATPPTIPSSADVVTLRRAGFWIRLWATFLDLILLGTLAAFVGPFYLLFWAAYHVAMWTWKGTTIGGIVAGIKVIRTDGRPVNFSVALVRSLSSFFSAIVIFLGFFWAGWDREKQAWHDKIAGTVVVRVPRSMSLVVL